MEVNNTIASVGSYPTMKLLVPMLILFAVVTVGHCQQPTQWLPHLDRGRNFKIPERVGTCASMRWIHYPRKTYTAVETKSACHVSFD